MDVIFNVSVIVVLKPCVKYAYHMVCTDCALQNKLCAKCKEKKDVAEPLSNVCGELRQAH